MKMPWRDQVLYPGRPAIGTSIRDDETAEIRDLANGQCLDIGTAEGYSAILMALSDQVRVVTTIDLFEPHISNKYRPVTQADFLGRVEAYNVSRKIMVRSMDSRIILPYLFSQGYRFDFIFVDGGHEDPAWSDILWARELCAPGGVVAVHDYLNSSTPQVRLSTDTWFSGVPHHVTGSMWVKEAK